MTAEPSEVLRAGLALSPADREEVALRLLESVNDGAEQDDVDAAWDAEINKRVDEIRSGTAEMLSWDEVRTQVEAELAANGL